MLVASNKLGNGLRCCEETGCNSFGERPGESIVVLHIAITGFNGFSAEGIYYAMVSGDLAGESIAGALATGQAAGPCYQARWKAEVGADAAIGDLIAGARGG